MVIEFIARFAVSPIEGLVLGRTLDHTLVCCWAARFVSALAAAGTVLILGLGLRGLIPFRARIWAAFVVAFSYGIIGLAHYSTIDVTVMFLSTAAIVTAVHYCAATFTATLSARLLPGGISSGLQV